PSLLHLYVQFQKHLPSQKRFKFLPGLGADLFQLLTGFADDDGLLRFTLDKDTGEYPANFLGFLETVHHNGGRVRDLFLSEQNYFFTDHISRARSLLVVADLIGGIEHRPFGKIFEYLPDQRIDVLAL